MCAEGYTGNGTYCSGKDFTIDRHPVPAPHLAVINACINNGGCDPMATCLSDPLAPGGRTCTCQPGRYIGDGIVCLRTYTHCL